MIEAPAPAGVDVWWLDVRAAAGRPEHVLRGLSPDERRRALRIGPAGPRAEFAVTRAVLRRLVAGYLGLPARGVRFGSSAHGKPVLEDDPRLEFNVSHSHGRAVLAFTRHGPVGVDVERVDPRHAIDRVAERCFGEAERERLARLSVERRRRAFFHGWTRKEAFVKALGTGLSHDLRSVAVAVGPDEPARLLGAEAERWQLVDLDAGPGYAAALVIARAGAPVVLRERSWSPGMAAVSGARDAALDLRAGHPVAGRPR